MKWLWKWYRKRLRRYDREWLFPEFFKKAESVEQATAAIMIHVSMDPAWRYHDEWQHEDIVTGCFRHCGPDCDHWFPPSCEHWRT